MYKLSPRKDRVYFLSARAVCCVYMCVQCVSQRHRVQDTRLYRFEIYYTDAASRGPR